MTYEDLDSFDRATVDRCLLGMSAHPDDMQAACTASGEESWHTFTMGLDLLVLCGMACEESLHKYELTGAGNARAADLLEHERLARRRGRLTAREASRCHSDLAYQHVFSIEHPLLRKLEAAMLGESCDPLTDDEAELVAGHIALQTGPSEQNLLDRLRNGTSR